MRFIVDANVGKLTRWLRLLGYDALFFDGKVDGEMISLALNDGRIILTRDTHIMEWGVVRSGRVRALLIAADDPETQMRQVVHEFGLDTAGSFSRCLECNQPLEAVDEEDIKERVPPYVFRTQEQFLECPKCHRVYWRGTHWRAMLKKLDKLTHSA